MELFIAEIVAALIIVALIIMHLGVAIGGTVLTAWVLKTLTDRITSTQAFERLDRFMGYDRRARKQG